MNLRPVSRALWRALASIPLTAVALAAQDPVPPAAPDTTRPPSPFPVARSVAPNVPGLTLPDAIRMAQERGHAARAARATRDAARYRDDAFGSRLLPQLALTGSLPQYNRSIIPVLQPDGSTLFRPQQQMNTDLNLRLSQRLPLTGGDLFVTSSLARLRLTGTSTTETWSSTPVAIGIRQDILRPNVLGWDRREQGLRAGRDERAYLEAMEDVAIQTTDLFYNVYAARANLDNALANAIVNDTLYRINTGRFEVGRIGENELLQSELAVLRQRAAVEAAQLDYERALASLRIALNLPRDQPINVTVDRTVPTYDADSALAAQMALRNRATVTDVELADVQARRAVAVARAAGGMGATVQATFGYNATAPEMNLAYENLREARTLTVAVTMPIWQWGARGESVRAARADQDRIASQGENTLEQLALDARFAALQLALARRNVDISRQADSVAGRRFEVAYNRYVIGRITVENLFIAQGEKDQALTQFAESLRRYWLAHYRLRRTTLFDFQANQPLR